MSLTRDAIITELETETKRTDKTTYFQDIFPDVIEEMCSAHTQDGEPIPLNGLKTDGTLTISDEDYYSDLPSDFIFQYGEPELLYDTDKGWLMIKKSLEWMNLNFPNRANNTSSKAKPQYYCLEKNRFDFAPMSDDDYTITLPYTKRHATVSSNSVTILFRDDFKPVIKDLCKAKLFGDLFQDNERGNFYYARGLNKLRSLAITDKRNAESVLVTSVNDF